MVQFCESWAIKHETVDQVVRMHSEEWLIHYFFTQNNFSYEKTQHHTFLCDHPEYSGICHNVLWWVHGLSTEFWVVQMEPLWDSFLHCCVTLTSVTTKTLPQWAAEVKVTWCQNPAECARRWPCCSNLDACALNANWLGTKWLSSLQSSEEAAWCSQISNYCVSSSYSGSVYKAEILCWRYIFTHNSLWLLCELSSLLCGKVCLWEMLFWKKITEKAICSYFLLDLLLNLQDL